MHEQLIVGWEPRHADLWGRHPIILAHTLASLAPFQPDALAWLIDRTPISRRRLLNAATASNGPRASAAPEAATGGDLMAAIALGAHWLTLQAPEHADVRWEALAEAMRIEIETARGVRISRQTLALHILSPRLVVPLHATLALEGLWILRGRLAVRHLPPEPPYLSQADRAAAFEPGSAGIDLSALDPALAALASPRLRLASGALFVPPQLSPLEITSTDEPVVVLTTLQWSTALARLVRMARANARLRRWGFHRPVSTATQGPGYWARSLIQPGRLDMAPAPWPPRIALDRASEAVVPADLPSIPETAGTSARS